LESSPSGKRPGRRTRTLRPTPAIPSSMLPGLLLLWRLWRARFSPRWPARGRSAPLHRMRRRKRQHRRTARAQRPPVKTVKVGATLGSSGGFAVPLRARRRDRRPPSAGRRQRRCAGGRTDPIRGQWPVPRPRREEVQLAPRRIYPISRPGSFARKRPAPASWRLRSGQSSARLRSSRQRRSRTLSAAAWRSSNVTHRLSSTL